MISAGAILREPTIMLSINAPKQMTTRTISPKSRVCAIGRAVSCPLIIAGVGSVGAAGEDINA